MRWLYDVISCDMVWNDMISRHGWHKFGDVQTAFFKWFPPRQIIFWHIVFWTFLLWHSIWRLICMTFRLTFYLAEIQTFYLSSILTFYCAFHLECLAAFFFNVIWHSSWHSLGALSDILSGIYLTSYLLDVLSGILSDIWHSIWDL